LLPDFGVPAGYPGQKKFHWRPVASTNFDGNLDFTRLMRFLLSDMELCRPRFGCYGSLDSLIGMDKRRNVFLF
jgi:hypothetical protein